MRGDSLRDLYAKTLALIGLGLLGGIGALVDYWPVAGDLPVAASADARTPAVAKPYLVADAMMPDFAARQRHAAALAGVSVAAAQAVPPPPPVHALPVSRVWTSDAVTEVALAAPPVPPLMNAIDVAPMHNLPVTRVALSEPLMPVSLPLEMAVPTGLPSVALGSSDDDAGFLADATDMMKKTGATIISGTMKAGAPFVSMAKFLGGAVRKITPFKN